LSLAQTPYKGLNVNQNDEDVVKAIEHALTRMVWTCIPIVATAAGLDVDTMGWRSGITLHALPSERPATRAALILDAADQGAGQ